MADPRAHWLPIPDPVALLLGRFTYYAAWLDDVLGEAVVIGNPDATDLAESTPGWADSGARLVAGIRSIAPEQPVIQEIADRLDVLNTTRNQLIHGVWLWDAEKVMVMKRQLGKGARQVSYGTYTYAEIEGFIETYQRLGNIADELITILMRGNPSDSALRNGRIPTCTKDGIEMLAVVRNELIVWECPTCKSWVSATPA